MNTAGATQSLDLEKEGMTEEMSNVLAYKQELRAKPEVQELTNEIDVKDTSTILKFGQAPGEEISKLSDELLSSMKGIKTEECSEMLTQLTKIMDKFDIQEIKSPEQATGIAKIFGNLKKSIEKLFAKYDSMGHEVDEITVILRKYEAEIYRANEQLQRMYDANNTNYMKLEQYIVAGEMGCEEIDTYKAQLENDPTIPPGQLQVQVQQLEMIRSMLEQRVYDLQIAENVSMQTAPMIQMMQQSNANLLRKINSSFIITLPIFKQCLIQAIHLKRAAIQSKAISDLDKATQELWQKNAQNTARQSTMIAKQAGSAAIDLASLERSYATITQGITDTKIINEDLARQRAADSTRLESMKSEMHKKGLA